MNRVKIFIIVMFLGLVLAQRELVLGMFFPKTAYAVGDLTVNFGVPAGTPLFQIQNSYPGQSITKSFSVTNSATTVRDIAIRGDKKNETGNLSAALQIKIVENAQDIYGGTQGTKTLSAFYAETTMPQFVSLGQLSPGQTKTYQITITFDTLAGNEYQGKTTTFDVHVGTAFTVPAACNGIVFSGQPIYGSERGDQIHGTARNDLIITLEGNDIVNAKAGDDCIIAGTGNDIVNGEAGDDVIQTEAGNDILNGGAGNDTMQGGMGNDIHNGDAGSDVMQDSLGTNTFTGGAGNDSLLGNILTDIASGNAGQDTCIAKIKTSCEL